jgi:Fe-S cluster assembly protein SufD
LDSQHTHIICSQELVELALTYNQQLRLLVDGACQQILVAVEDNVEIKMIIEYETAVACDLGLQVVLGENSTLTIVALFFTNQSIQQRFSFVLSGNRSRVELKALAVLSGSDRIKIETVQTHRGVDTKSCVTVASLVSDSASFNYQGIIHIEKQASKADADQQNKNIMLSETASVRSVPTIEVLNKNVRCFHGSAIGKFDKDSVWYLQSRGLEARAVEKILIDSFVAPVINTVPWAEEIKNKIQKKIR